MANRLFDHGRNEFLIGDLDWVDHDIKMILVDTNDKDPDTAVDDNLNDISTVSGAVVATTGVFEGKDATAGVADADDAEFSAVTGDVSEELVIYYDSGTATTSTLIVCIDTATGLSVTPNGGDITVQWDSGSNKIFKL